MNTERVNASAVSVASMAMNNAVAEVVKIRGRFDVEFFDQAGNLVWREQVKNLVTTVGKNALLDNHLSGSGYTAAWYLGLVNGASTPTFDAADTAASHAGWTEFTSYDAANRPAPAFNAASGGSKSTTQTSFDINANGTVAGCFMISNNTKGGTTGVLYSCGAFSGGNQPVTAGGTLRVTYTAQA